MDLRDPSEDDYVAMENAARSKLGLVGITRTKSDFRERMETFGGDVSDEDVDAMWARYEAKYGWDYTETVERGEYRAWESSFDDTVAEMQAGRPVPEGAMYGGRTAGPSEVRPATMVLDERQVGDVLYSVQEDRIAGGGYVTTVKYTYTANVGDDDSPWFAVLGETERFASDTSGGWSRLGPDDRSSYTEHTDATALQDVTYGAVEDARAAAERLARMDQEITANSNDAWGLIPRARKGN